jgi:hypothetical protein
MHLISNATTHIEFNSLIPGLIKGRLSRAAEHIRYGSNATLKITDLIMAAKIVPPVGVIRSGLRD